MDPLLKQQLCDLLSAHGEIEGIHLLDSDPQAGRLILATMATPEAARAAHLALGFSSFGFNSLIIDENKLLHFLQDQ